MQLREWQEQLQAAILTGDGEIVASLQDRAPSREGGVQIYANAYAIRLREALRCNYEALYRLLGDTDFAAMARHFAEIHPPATASIRWYGDRLPDFLAELEPYGDCPALAELARFEWALRHTVDAADAERVDAMTLQALAPERWAELLCELHPSLTILQFEWNAPQIWRALDADEEPPQPARNAGHWLVYRAIDRVSRWRSADATEVALLRSWQRGATFGELGDELECRLGDASAAAAAAASYLRVWLAQGLLVQTADTNTIGEPS